MGKTGVKPAETQVSTRGKETFFAETLDFLPGERGRVGPKAGRDKTPGPVEKGGIKMEGYGTMPGAAMACMTASLRTPLCKISSTGEIEQRFRLN